MIPKTIHYCWFGGNPKSRLIRRCIKSWHKYCPGYTIIEWNESNFDITCSEYVRKAYEQKKWAFVADYARFWVLNQYGGVYLDTDVQLLRPIDTLLEQGKFAGFANEKIVATGLIMAAEKEDWLCRRVLRSYEGEQFVWNDDPSKMFAIGRRVTNILVEEGLKLDGSEQTIRDYTIYPKYYFNSTDGDLYRRPDERAYSVHHYAATWFTGKKRFKNTLRRLIGHRALEKYHAIRSVFKNRVLKKIRKTKWENVGKREE